MHLELIKDQKIEVAKILNWILPTYTIWKMYKNSLEKLYNNVHVGNWDLKVKLSSIKI